MRVILFLLLSFGLSNSGFSIPDSTARGSIYAEALGRELYSVNYEYQLNSKWHLGVGLSHDWWLNDRWAVPIYTGISLGRNKHHLVIQTGLINYLELQPFPSTQAARDSFKLDPDLVQSGDYVPPYHLGGFTGAFYQYTFSKRLSLRVGAVFHYAYHRFGSYWSGGVAPGLGLKIKL